MIGGALALLAFWLFRDRPEWASFWSRPGALLAPYVAGAAALGGLLLAVFGKRGQPPSDYDQLPKSLEERVHHTDYLDPKP